METFVVGASEDWFNRGDPVYEALIAGYERERAAIFSRWRRGVFRRCRDDKSHLLYLQQRREREEAVERQKQKAAETRAARSLLYRERQLVAAQFPNQRVRRAMALTLSRKGKSWREIGEVVGCGGERAKQLADRAEREERGDAKRWRM